MADKDRSYDPQPEDDYISNTTHSDRELNNNKVSSPTHPGSLMGVFVLNDIGSECGEAAEDSGGWRRGGPLMNPAEKEKKDEEKQDKKKQEDSVEKKNQPAKKLMKRCINKRCKRLTDVLYQGTRFECDESYAEEPEQLKAHNQLCKECAMTEARCHECPVHADCYYKDDADDIIPEVAPEE